MPRRPSSRPKGPIPKKLHHNDGHRSRNTLDSDLSSVLVSIATLLISSGYAYGKMSKLARIAFVDAANRICGIKERKPSMAQIAAATGLTRTEVSNIIRQKRQNPLGYDTKNRVANVVAGWVTDGKYLTTSGVPRALHFKASHGDFTSLVRKYSGDIPARAMLREMQRLRMVTRGPNDILRLTRHNVPVAAANLNAIRAVEPWMSVVKDAASGSTNQKLSAKTTHIKLHFDSVPQVLAVMRDLKRRRAAFVKGVAELSGRSAKDAAYSLRITIAVAVASPIRVK